MSGPTFWPDLINMPQTQATPLPPWPLTLDCNGGPREPRALVARGACLGGPGQKTIKWGKKPAGAEGRAFRRRGATPAYKTGGPPPPPLLTAAAPTPSQDLTATPPADMVPATHAAPLLLSLLLLSGAARAQHGPGGNPGAGPAPGQDAARAPPPPAILLHRQALTTDGAFNFAFRAENGLQQGESIAPDGSRRGAYSYVDPNGRTISVRYTAGKDGFKVLEGEPSPGAAAPPQQLQARPQPQLAYQQQPQPQLAYQPQPQLRPQPQLAYQPQPQPQAQLAYRQPQQPAVYQTAAATPRPPPSPAAYQPAVRAQPLPYPQPVQHAQPPYQVQVTPRPAPPAPQGSLGLFRSTAPATFPQQQHQQQAPQLQQTPIEEPQEEQDNGPHSFGQGYSFEFQG
ncbi:tyrosine-protein phosphatase non-receptor type 23-like [Schistocerca piceifrons]|uniref:tyrosine-protein phosphatase non-receptor type 23-like n=1 Tax=Schistocerca piceifrons TaxID=274613 RepID=UPI001F5E3A1E|nr:tyrosine-protein phosphatase non-receptor type 23-like [Schistocerca piceifrons]